MVCQSTSHETPRHSYLVSLCPTGRSACRYAILAGFSLPSCSVSPPPTGSYTWPPLARLRGATFSDDAQFWSTATFSSGTTRSHAVVVRLHHGLSVLAPPPHLPSGTYLAPFRPSLGPQLAVQAVLVRLTSMLLAFKYSVFPMGLSLLEWKPLGFLAPLRFYMVSWVTLPLYCFPTSVLVVLVFRDRLVFQSSTVRFCLERVRHRGFLAFLHPWAGFCFPFCTHASRRLSSQLTVRFNYIVHLHHPAPSAFFFSAAR